jgi:hypothetical protein
VFGLDESSLGTEYENPSPNQDDKVSEPVVAVPKIERRDAHLQPISLEETRRQARENWLRLRQHKIEDAKGVSNDHDADRDARQDQNQSLDNDADE